MSLEYPFVFPLKNGLHARPASVLRDAANRFHCAVSLRNGRNGRVANAKSVLAMVGAEFRLNDAAVLVTAGDDESAAMAFLRKFLGEEFPSCDEPLPEIKAAPGALLVPRMIAESGAVLYRGTPVSRGLALAPVVMMDGLALPSGFAEAATNREEECAALTQAVEAVTAEIEERLTAAVNKAERGVLKAHLAVAQDPEFAEKARDIICRDGRTAAAAVLKTARDYADMLMASESLYLRERVLDIRDVAGQLLRKLCGDVSAAAVKLETAAVVAADMLTPSEFLALDRSLLRGLVLSEGGTMSHTVILARAFGVPCVTGVPDIHQIMRPGRPVLVDAKRGLVIPEPPEAVRHYYELEMRAESLRNDRLATFHSQPGSTGDGRRIEIAANVSSAAEAEAAFAQGAEGIGLFRTEMLFLERAAAPSEEEQYAEYRRAVVAAAGRPVIIRTLDIGGDKPLGYLDLPKEENPFLGCRAVRFYAAQKTLVKTQLRAILRAAAGGNVRLMIPMVGRADELRSVKEILAEAEAELAAAVVEFSRAVGVGVMLEVPAAVFAIAQLAREVSFFSLGTNDLAQYFFAADRSNPAVAELADPLQPEFLQLLKKAVGDAHAANRWIGMCGEMAGREEVAPLLLGLGLDEISMAAPLVPGMKAAVHARQAAECDALLEKALALADAVEVRKLLWTTSGQAGPTSVLHPDIVLLESTARTRGEAIKELVDRLWLAGRTAAADKVEEAIWRREDSYSTGVGFGFAIPHCKSPELTANSIGILKLQTPVDWQSADGQPVRMVLMLAVREADGAEAHIKIFAKLARKIMHEEFRERLLHETNAEAMVSYIRECLDCQ